MQQMQSQWQSGWVAFHGKNDNSRHHGGGGGQTTKSFYLKVVGCGTRGGGVELFCCCRFCHDMWPIARVW